MRADVTLFIDILLDTDLHPVFTVDDTEQVEAIYGPVHSRLLKQALDLIRDADDAKSKVKMRHAVPDGAGAPDGPHAGRTATNNDGWRIQDVG